MSIQGGLSGFISIGIGSASRQRFSRLDVAMALVITECDGSPTMTPRGLIGNTVRTTQKGTETVAAPATVSGLPSILVAPEGAMPLCRSVREGRWATDIREPGDLPSNIDPSSRAGKPDTGAGHDNP